MGRLLSLAAGWPEQMRAPLYELARTVVRSSDEHEPQTVRSAVEFLGIAGAEEDIGVLLATAELAAKEDPVLTHSARIAIRNLIGTDQKKLQRTVERLNRSGKGDEPETNVLPEMFVGILPGINLPSAAHELADQVQKHYHEDRTLVATALNELLRHLASGQIPVERIVVFLQDLSEESLLSDVRRFDQVASRYWFQQGSVPPPLAAYGDDLLFRRLVPALEKTLGDFEALEWRDDNNEVWKLQERTLASKGARRLLSSHTLGESYTGSLRSEAFKCPEEIRFWLAGHNRPPYEEQLGENVAKLVDARTGELYLQALVPRSDTAKEIVWDTSSLIGVECQLELRDGDGHNAYAWIAAGEFSIPGLNSPGSPDLVEAMELLLRTGAFSDVEQVLASVSQLSLGERAVGRLKAHVAQGLRKPVYGTLIETALSVGRLDLVTALSAGQLKREELKLELARELCSTATSQQQTKLAKRLSASSSGVRLIGTLLLEGRLSQSSVARADILLPDDLDADSRKAIIEAQRNAAETGDEMQQVTERVNKLTWSSASAGAGAKLFQQHCASCHQLRGEGKIIGPQLDGAVSRSPERLAEDILLPNHNVDVAFRQTTLLLEDETIVNGLSIEQPDGSLLLTDTEGKQRSIPADRIRARKPTSRSLMPSNYGELLDDQQLTSLLLFLKRPTQDPVEHSESP